MTQPTNAPPGTTGPDIHTVPGPSLGDISGAPQVQPERAPRVKEAAFLDWAGVKLARLVLYMMATFVFIMLVLTFLSERRAAGMLNSAFTQFQQDAADSSTFKLATDRLAQHQESFRTFWKEIINTVLLNVLLPVLTALLGYVFGRQGAEENAVRGTSRGTGA